MKSDARILLTVGSLLLNAPTLSAQDVKAPAMLKGHQDSVRCLAFSGDGKTLASGGSDETVRLWDVATGNAMATLNARAGQIWVVAFAPDGKTVAAGTSGYQGGSGVVQLWDLGTRQEWAVLKGSTDEDEVVSLAFSPDGKLLASGAGSAHDSRSPGLLKVWDLASRKERFTRRGRTNLAEAIAFTQDGERLASGGGDGTVRLWDVDSGRELAIFKGHDGGVRFVTFLSDEKTLVVCSSRGTVKLWDVATGTERAKFRQDAEFGQSWALSAERKLLAAGSFTEGKVRLWDVSTGKERATLERHAPTVEALAFTPDGGLLASGDFAGMVRLWDVGKHAEKQADKSSASPAKAGHTPLQNKQGAEK